MKVVSDTHGEVVRHFRTIEIEDGPVVDCGESPASSYMPGTMIIADKLQMEWTGNAGPITVLVSGDYVGVNAAVNRNRYDVRYRISDGLPQWIQEILQ